MACPPDVPGAACLIDARRPADGGPVWSQRVANVDWPATTDAVDPAVSGFEPIGGARPAAAQEVLGIPVDAGVAVIAVASGALVRTVPGDPNVRFFLASGQLIASKAVWQNGSCVLTLEATDLANGRTTWRKDGLDLGTVTGSGCQQGDPPRGATGVLEAEWNHRDLLFSVEDGRELWVGEPSESLLGKDGTIALVGSDGGVDIIDVPRGNFMDRIVGRAVNVWVADRVAVVKGPDALTLIRLEEYGGPKWSREFTTFDSVIALGAKGMVLYSDDRHELSYVEYE